MDLTPAPWMANAVCAGVDAELWFPEKGGTNQAAKAICRRCPVIAECLEYALARQELGIWGGTSERERIALARAKTGAA